MADFATAPVQSRPPGLPETGPPIEPELRGACCFGKSCEILNQTQCQEFGGNSACEEEPVDVTPVAREATTRLLDAGVIETDGFSHVVIGLYGEIRGELTRPGRVGVVLLPDLDVAERFLKTKGVFLFPLEVSAALDPAGSSVFMSRPARFEVGFPRYRVLLYNTTDKTVIATVSAYRTK